jgi:UDP-N-acetylglucosamine--N-acetylmuramyl-(pentapeptide) pyrophosphoryl-undecaprenol N-acetylglucosamine transferase
MKIVAAGGGSGGHVTPVVAVLNELSRLDPQLEAHFICDKKFAAQATELMSRADLTVDVTTIYAGKLRRYHTVAAWRQLLDIPTTLRNIFDLGLIAIGTIQSVWHLLRIRPDVVFTKGGFVCVPVALAAKLIGAPIVLHDSDAHPGLANRIIARFASSIATGAPLEHYPGYPEAISHFVGTPVDRAYQPFDESAKKAGRTWLGFPDIDRPLVVITGGGLGARRINEAVVESAQRLVDAGVSIYHITGHTDFAVCESRAPESVHYRLVPFVSERMVDALGSADVVVTRAGATTLLELAALQQAVIIVPNPLLTGGHQLKNAVLYEKADAAVIYPEEQLTDRDKFAGTILDLLKDEKRRTELSKRIATFAKSDAALDVAQLIVDAKHGAVTRGGK